MSLRPGVKELTHVFLYPKCLASAPSSSPPLFLERDPQMDHEEDPRSVQSAQKGQLGLPSS